MSALRMGVRMFRLAPAAALLAAASITFAAPAAVSQKGTDHLIKEVRHEILMQPYYGVFDNVAYRVDGYKVTLLGQVTRPVLKSNIEKAVKGIEGVESVNNQIEVLPLSPNDDSIRLAAYRAIYGYPALQRYGLNTIAPIRIVVKNGNITLEGVVANEGDKNMIGIRANGVSGAFKVTNNLRLDSDSK